MENRDVLAVFNRGLVSKYAQARTDVSRVALSASLQTNWVSWKIGPMSLRPGLGFNGQSNDDGVYLPFVFNSDDTALIDLTPSELRIWDDGDTLVQRDSRLAVVANGTFTSDLASWTDDDDAGATSEWEAGSLKLTGTGELEARRYQTISIDAGEVGEVHGLRVNIQRGPCYIRVGTTPGNDDVFSQAVLRTGSHSLAFIPGATVVHITFASPLDYPVLVDDVAFEGAGPLVLSTPWATAEACRLVRWDQSGDVVFCASGKDIRQYRIERRNNNSWSIVQYLATDGPFLTENLENLSITPSALTGEITLTASRDLFKSGHVGSVWQITSEGQRVEDNLSSEAFSDPIRVTGVESGRIFQVIISGTFTGTLTLQRSVGDVGSWVDVNSYTNATTANVDDGFDNAIIFYRIGFKSGDYTSGTASVALDFAAGSIIGSILITGYTSATLVDAIVLNALGGTGATTSWAEGAWSDVQGWPTAVAVSEGRLWWSAAGRNYASASDNFTSYDTEDVGDARPINRRVGEGAVDRVNWLLSLTRLICGGDTAEHSIRSNSFDEPITQDNYNSKRKSTKGSAQVPAVEVDGRGYFVGKDTRTLYELASADGYEFSATQTTVLVPEIGNVGIVRIAVQIQPDVRVFCVLSDGTVALLLRDAEEDILCWQTLETDGDITDVTVLPGLIEDRVLFRVKRFIDDVTVYYLEEMARMDQCRGAADSRLADSFVTKTGSFSIMDGLGHLEDEEVVVWADAQDKGAFTVVGGQINLGETVTQACAGLTYRARWKSSKLAGQTRMGLSLSQLDRINKVGLLLADAHYQGLKFGQDFDDLDNLPLMVNGAPTPDHTVWDVLDDVMIEFPGDWGPNDRICLQAAAPRPCTVLGMPFHIDRQDAP